MSDLYLENLRRDYQRKRAERKRTRLRAVLFLLALILALAILAIVDEATAGERKASTSVSTISDSMVFVVQPYRTHPVVTDPQYRKEIAEAIFEAGKATGIPDLFLTALFFRESSFRKEVVSGKRRGTRHEVGLGQVNGVARFWCKRQGFNQKTIAGQAMCSASWLAKCRDDCGGSLKRGLAFYSTGKTCDPRYAYKVVKDRHELWQRLEEEAAK